MIKNEARVVIGHWIDDNYLSSLMTLYKNNGKVYLETLYADNSKSVKEQTETSVHNGIRYENKTNEHGEYFIVNKEGLLNYYSQDGLFNQIKKTTYTQYSKKL